MRQHEREFFVSRTRAGVYIINTPNLKLKVYTPTIEDEYEINEAYMEAFDRARNNDIMTQDEMLEYMISTGMWTDNDNKLEIDFKKDIEYLKTELFHSRTDSRRLQKTRTHIETAKTFLQDLMRKKYAYQENTCEGISAIAKSSEFIKRCTRINNELYDFEDISIGEILNLYYSMVLPESVSREIARNEPWRSLWILAQSNTFTLFHNKERELSIDQRNLLVWSKMYDNVQESHEAPAEDVIEDDDMLDGWFILQKQKRDKSRLHAEMEANSNSKINQSGEVCIIARSKEDRERIESMNSTHSKVIKQQRINSAKQKGTIETGQFSDERIDMQSLSNEQFKGKFRS